MVLNIENLILTKQYLNNKYGQENIFQFLFPEKISKKLYKNPLRDDKKEGCSFVYMGSSYIFKDFSININYSWVDFGMELMRMTYQELLIYVNTNMNGQVSYTPVIKSEYTASINEINIKSKDFTDNELFKFKDFLCTKEMLQQANIYSVKTIYYNGECAFENCFNIYAFLNIDERGKRNYQLYFPNKEKSKRYRSVTTKLIPQLENIDLKAKYVIITKSNMDAFILKHILHFNSIAILNEGILLSDEFMNKLNSKYKIILLFDNDKAGRAATIKYINYFKHIQFQVLFIPFKYGKDIKDVVSNYNIQDVKQISVIFSSISFSILSINFNY